MAGGNWTAQNKVRPGIYINFTSRGGGSLTPGQRGTLAACKALSWGPVGEIMTIHAGDSLKPFTGYDITEPQARFLREAFKGPPPSCSTAPRRRGQQRPPPPWGRAASP